MNAPAKARYAGYFKISLSAARAIVSSSDGPETLAGYIVLREGAFGTERNQSACGAKAISKYCGFTDWRSKRVMDDLRSLCFGERGASWLIRDTGDKEGNARIYAFGNWEGSQAYLPALLVKSNGEVPAPLHRICSSDEDPETKRDALLMLLQLYADTDYAGWFGAAPDCFAYQDWDTEGDRAIGDDLFELGLCGEIGGYGLWMIAPPLEDEWTFPVRLRRELFVEGMEVAEERIWQALWFLLSTGAVCKVAVVVDGSRPYPLWVFSPAYRNTLAERHGLRADLAKHFQRLAGDVLGASERIFRAAYQLEPGEEGTGIYFCVAKSRPTVRTLLVPRLHAPTPINMDGLVEMSKITSYWISASAKLRAKARIA